MYVFRLPVNYRWSTSLSTISNYCKLLFSFDKYAFIIFSNWEITKYHSLIEIKIFTPEDYY